MFNKNTYMIPHGSSPSTSVLDVNVNEILLHHHDIFSGHYLAAAVCPPADSAAAAALFNQDIGEHSGTIQNSTCPRTPKRDRHSKIDTAQGPRDRRVRLSIGVARKFFDLQEMLGFDKPSKTLDWLLTKSKSSIKDLVHTKQQSNNPSTGGVVSSPSDECDAENDEYALDTEKDSKGKSVITSNNNKLHCKGGAGSKDPAKESRVKARARARERTREKMCIKQLNETRNATSYCDLMNNNPLNNNNNSSSSTNIPIQYMNNQLEFCRISGSNSGKLCGARDQMMMHYPMSTNYQESAGGGDLIQESIVIKRKVKNNNNNNHHHPPSILGFQPNLILSSSNYGIPFSGYNYNNATDQNWNVGGFNSSESNLSAILDQHNFNNR